MMEIRRDRKERCLYLSQRSYLEKVISRFGMEKAKSVSTSLAAHFLLPAMMSPGIEEEKKHMKKVSYASIVGSLMYAMICTRLDIAQAVSVVSRYMTEPRRKYWEAVKWILRYLKGTLDVGLVYGGTTCEVSGFVDSDYAGDLDRCKSTIRYIYMLYGAPVSWRSILQHTVALSTIEVEYIAMEEAVKEALWLGRLTAEMGVEQSSVVLQCDSQSATSLAKNIVLHARSKHIDIHYHFLLDIVEDGTISLCKVDTKDNPVDMLTKVILVSKFQHCVKLLQISRSLRRSLGVGGGEL